MFLIERDGTISRVIEGWNKAEIEWLGGIAGVAPFRAGRQCARSGRPAEAPAIRLPAGVDG